MTEQNTQKNGIIYLCFLGLMPILGEEGKEELSKETISSMKIIISFY